MGAGVSCASTVPRVEARLAYQVVSLERDRRRLSDACRGSRERVGLQQFLLGSQPVLNVTTMHAAVLKEQFVGADFGSARPA